MTKNRFVAAADEFRQLPGVIECVSWSDSVSVRYSGMLRTLRHRAHELDLFPVNLDGVFYAMPMPIENDAGDSRNIYLEGCPPPTERLSIVRIRGETLELVVSLSPVEPVQQMLITPS